MTFNKVTILCSGVALGVYVPGLLLEGLLRRRGLRTEVSVLENFLQHDHKSRLCINKQAFHNSFSVALAGQKLARDLRPVLDDSLLQALYDYWDRTHQIFFIVFSGFWIPIIEEYQARTRNRYLRFDLCFMDAAISASWRLFQQQLERFPKRSLFDGQARSLPCTLPFFTEPDIPYDTRSERYIIHGGGWGMGTYKEMISKLEQNDLALDIIAYDYTETTDLNQGQRVFMVDPTWNPWNTDKNGRHTLPPFGEIRIDELPIFATGTEHHGFFDVARQARAIISKPGGATLLDSLISATPLISLDPFGSYEQVNADLWHHLGLGLPYKAWEASGFDMELLKACHRRLVQVRSQTQNYVDLYLHDIIQETDAV
jgi:hypothetical protein